MDLHNSIFSQGRMLCEQLAAQISEIIPETGLIVIIMDDEGSCWPNDTERFEKSNLTKEWLNNFSSKINDGVEPLISQLQDYHVVGSQLCSGHNKYGYIFIAIEGTGVESTFSKFELIELLLNQFNLVAELIEKCNSMYQVQSKLCSQAVRN